MARRLNADTIRQMHEGFLKIKPVIEGHAHRKFCDLHGEERAVEDLALAFQASLLVRHAPAAVADAFCASRLDARHGVYGALPSGLDTGAIVRRATPEAS